MFPRIVNVAVWVLVVLAMTACAEKPAEETEPVSERPGARPATSCGVAMLSDSGVGAVRIGRAVSEIQALCRVVRDTTVLASEGQSARKITVAFDDGRTVDAEVVDERVWRVEVRDPRVVTEDSLGVRMPLARLMSLAGVRPIYGEGRVFVVTDAHCGLSFQLGVGSTVARNPPRDRAGLERLPQDTPVVRILVVGCRNAP